MSKDYKFLGLYEPDVSWTDLLITLECLIFALLLVTQPNLIFIQKLLVGLFICTALASLFGGILHGCFRVESGRIYNALWKLVLTTLVFNGTLLLMLTNQYITFKVGSPIIQIAAGGSYVFAGVFWIFFKSSAFKTALLFYLPPTLLLLSALLYRVFSQTVERAMIYAISALVLTLIAGSVQHWQIAVHKKFFNHNALYHLIQAIGLFFFYLWAVGASEAG